MAMENKTEKPTPKKQKEAREKGQVLKSNDVNTAFILIVMFGVLKLFGGYTVKKLGDILSSYLTEFNYQIISAENMNKVFLDAIFLMFISLFPLLLAAVIASLIINYLQVGFLLSGKILKPNLNKLNPISGFKKMFSLRSIVELLKASIKAIVISYLVYKEIKNCFSTFPMLVSSNLNTSIQYIIDLIMGIAFKVSIALIIIAGFDYFYQWWDRQKQLRMTKQEVKDEYKQTEGDPRVKGKIRQKQQQMGMMRMMKDVPLADVIITNPTHFAIALKYDEKKASAPIVVAKGADYLALKIKEIAKENKVKIIENKPLARALYEVVEIGDMIPQEFYIAVAEILAEIYAIKKKR